MHTLSTYMVGAFSIKHVGALLSISPNIGIDLDLILTLSDTYKSTPPNTATILQPLITSLEGLSPCPLKIEVIIKKPDLPISIFRFSCLSFPWNNILIPITIRIQGNINLIIIPVGKSLLHSKKELHQ